MPRGKALSGSYLKPVKSLGAAGRKVMREEMGRFICKHRIAAKLEQEELATRCGHSYNIVNKWENAGKPHLEPEDAEKLIEILKLPSNSFEPYKDILIKREYKKSKDPSIGIHIGKRLKEKKITPSELARMMDLYPQHIDGWIKGGSEPRLSQVKAVVEILFPEDMRMEGMNYIMFGTPLPKQSYAKLLVVAMDRVKFLEQELESKVDI